jgi:membrane protease YdiL (CAAX protease family)
MIDRRGLLKTAALVYLALTALALVIAWLAGVDLRPLLRFSWTQAAIGLAAVVPMSIAFFIAPDLKDRVVDLLGPALAQCRVVDLLLLAAMAGICEELVFRGAIEGWLLRYDIVAAMIVTNVLFGLMHPITLVYFLIAAGFGFYFSMLANLEAERNLTAPIVAHTVYDFLGFRLVARDYRRSQRESFEMVRQRADAPRDADLPRNPEPAKDPAAVEPVSNRTDGGYTAEEVARPEDPAPKTTPPAQPRPAG